MLAEAHRAAGSTPPGKGLCAANIAPHHPPTNVQIILTRSASICLGGWHRPRPAGPLRPRSTTSKIHRFRVRQWPVLGASYDRLPDPFLPLLFSIPGLRQHYRVPDDRMTRTDTFELHQSATPRNSETFQIRSVSCPPSCRSKQNCRAPCPSDHVAGSKVYNLTQAHHKAYGFSHEGSGQLAAEFILHLLSISKP